MNGSLYRNSYKKTQFFIAPLTRILQYNTVEGWCLSPDLKWRKRWDDKRKLELNSNVRYGFSNTHLNINAGGTYLAHPLKESLWTVKTGSVTENIMGEEVITPFLNTVYTLFDEKNLAKLYEKRFLKLGYSREWFNGFTAELNAEFAQRLSLLNTSDEHVINKVDRYYTSNNPLFPIGDVPLFQKHNALITALKINYTIGKKYISRPDLKIATETKWPELNFSWKQGIPSIFDSKVSFTQITTGLKHTLDFGIAGYLNYRASYTWFANKQQLNFLDYVHFKGNQTLFSDFEAERFYHLGYYSNSTSEPVFSAHGEYRFNHFLFNKIPLLRKLKLQEIMSLHYLQAKGFPAYGEIAFGVEKFQLVRIDVFGAYTGKSKPVFGLRFGVMIF